MGIDRFDSRLVARKLRQGDLSNDEHQAHLAELPDLSDNVDVVTAQVGVGEDEVESEEVDADVAEGDAEAAEDAEEEA